jgi:hypothetical protein
VKEKQKHTNKKKKLIRVRERKEIDERDGGIF